jgi:xanthine dehydrogenase/oxidase
MPRAQNTHANVNAGFLFTFKEDHTIEAATIVFGNINPIFVHATGSENLLVGKKLFDNDTLQQVYSSLSEELDPDFVPPEPSQEFRKQLAIALFYKVISSFL